jgi:hypothetical protein
MTNIAASKVTRWPLFQSHQITALLYSRLS